MNKIANNFLSTGNKFKPQMHLRQPRFKYSAYKPKVYLSKRTR